MLDSFSKLLNQILSHLHAYRHHLSKLFNHFFSLKWMLMICIFNLYHSMPFSMALTLAEGRMVSGEQNVLGFFSLTLGRSGC